MLPNSPYEKFKGKETNFTKCCYISIMLIICFSFYWSTLTLTTIGETPQPVQVRAYLNDVTLILTLTTKTTGIEFCRCTMSRSQTS